MKTVAPANRRIGAFHWNIGWRRRVTSPPNCRAFPGSTCRRRRSKTSRWNPPLDLQRISSWALIGIFVLMLAVAMSVARTLLVPIVSAGVLAFMLGPWVTAMRKWGVPPSIFAAAVVIGALLIIHAAIVQGSTIAVDWVGRAPELLASFSDKLRSAFGPAFSLERLQSTFARSDGGGPFDAAAILQSDNEFSHPHGRRAHCVSRRPVLSPLPEERSCAVTSSSSSMIRKRGCGRCGSSIISNEISRAILR